MSDYRRAYVPGGSFFFTVVTERREPIFRAESARRALGSVLRECLRQWPFRLDALVLLDEHCHAVWTLPEGDTRYSARWGFIKKPGSTYSREFDTVHQKGAFSFLRDHGSGISEQCGSGMFG